MRKNKAINLLKRIIIFTIFLLSSSCFVSDNLQAERSTFSLAEINYLISQVQDPRINETYLNKVFSTLRLKRHTNLVNMNVVNKEQKNQYEKFTSPYALMLAKRFSTNWRTMLRKASKHFNVEQEIIVAILLVETNFGKILGKNRLISVFSSIIIENHPQRKQDLFKKIFATNPEITQEYVSRRLEAKAIWATKELETLLLLGQEKKLNPLKVRGSYAGAFGIPQFLPSSYQKWGYDSDDNGSINLFLFPDAIFSTANYLHSHGWEPKIDQSRQKEVIFAYNRSDNYVNAVLKLCNMLKNREKRQAKKQPREKPDRSQSFFGKTEFASQP